MRCRSFRTRWTGHGRSQEGTQDERRDHTIKRPLLTRRLCAPSRRRTTPPGTPATSQSLLQLLTDGVVIINPYGETTAGRDEVELFFAALFDGVGKGSRHSSLIRGVHFVRPDVALVDAEAVISDFGPGPQPVRHSFTDVLVRTSDGWRINHVRAYVFMPRPPI